MTEFTQGEQIALKAFRIIAKYHENIGCETLPCASGRCCSCLGSRKSDKTARNIALWATDPDVHKCGAQFAQRLAKQLKQRPNLAAHWCNSMPCPTDDKESCKLCPFDSIDNFNAMLSDVENILTKTGVNHHAMASNQNRTGDRE